MDQLSAIETTNLTKHYGRVRALSDLTLKVEEGSVFGFLGANGAGKTTTIRLLMGLLRPTGGTALVLGRHAGREGVSTRSEIGYLPGELALYPGVSGREIIEVLGSFYPATPWREELCDALEMSASDLGRRTGEYSTGMKQKIGIIQALQHAPRLAILDEPTSGLDPLVRRSFFEFIRLASDRGTTVFMSTHVLSDVERMCDMVGIIRDGHLLVVDSVESLRRSLAHRIEVTFHQPVDMSWTSEYRITIRQIAHPPNTYIIGTEGDIGPVLAELSTLPVASLVSERPSLDDIFLKYYSGDGGENV